MSNAMLDELYSTLDYQSGTLLVASETPQKDISIEEWLEKGEWLAAAKRAGAEKVFFVDNNPVIIFAECAAGYMEKERAFNRVWCLGRPRLLFLASPGELSVYDLASMPIKIDNTRKEIGARQKKLKALAAISTAHQVAKVLYKYHRDKIESGQVFGDYRFGDIKNRADKALIRDLKTVRNELIKTGLSGQKLRYAHALIGRSVFIRYLEDREVITCEYFYQQAGDNTEWVNILEGQHLNDRIDLSEKISYYSRILVSKDFTYTLYRSLARDFNGDMFLDIDAEAKTINQCHLDLVQRLMYGDADEQVRLFFYSYDFRIVPLDLISSIYEEFYNPSTEAEVGQSKVQLDGAYYTPPVLAELTVSKVLTIEQLSKKPRVLDPSCGSGIFLVEAFRRIVRYEWFKAGRSLSFNKLKNILKHQIAGIEVNEEAAKIAAFSLCLALLHYLTPPAITKQINKGNKLPNLLVSNDDSDNHFHSILVENAFDVAKIKKTQHAIVHFGDNCADVIVSNPPWGSLTNAKDKAIKERNKVVSQWCERRKLPIGDKDASQAFLWRYLDLLRKDGAAAVLVPAGVLLKGGNKSQDFRKHWTSNIQIKEVINFTHVRGYFFKDTTSPFILSVFKNGNQENVPVLYQSAKRVAALKETRAILLNKYDINVVRNEDLSSNELWKTYWFGRTKDRQLVRFLQSRERLSQYVDHQKTGGGFAIASETNSTEEFRSYGYLKVLKSRYDLPEFTKPPTRVIQFGFGVVDDDNDKRVMVNEGINQSLRPKGQVLAQYLKGQFCFSESLYGIKLQDESEECYKILTGIIWSSLARYYLFMTASSWGVRNDKLLKRELLDLPVIFDNNNSATTDIISTVSRLIEYRPAFRSIKNPEGVEESDAIAQRENWEYELNEAVFKLFELSEEQKDLVRDFCEVTLPFYYEPYSSLGANPAVEEDTDNLWIKGGYIDVFTQRWNAYLDSGMEMRALQHINTHKTLIALEFFPADKDDDWELKPKTDTWHLFLDQVEKYLQHPISTSYIISDGIVHVVSDESVVVIKRNEKRFWTRSLAQEDSDITLYKRAIHQSSNEKDAH